MSATGSNARSIGYPISNLLYSVGRVGVKNERMVSIAFVAGHLYGGTAEQQFSLGVTFGYR